MRPVIEFVKTTLIGGLLVVLPMWLTVLLLMKVVNGALTVLKPIAKLVPQTIVHDNLVALALLLAICFVTGLLIRTKFGQRLGQSLEQRVLDRVPGYTLFRSLTLRLAGQEEGQSFQPALAEIEEALVPAFVVEKHADGQFTVFVSSSPTPMAGAIYILPPERVHVLDVPLTKAMLCISKWGAGSGELLAAMRRK
jgi:uncharacterized membrane protein